jgi:hypothetical protein
VRVGSALEALAVPCCAAVFAACAASTAFAGTTYGPNGPSNVNTSRETVSRATDLTVGIINDRINQATADAGFGVFTAGAGTKYVMGNGGGMAAGSEPPRIGFWGSLGATSVRDWQPGADYYGTIISGVAGVDYRFRDWLLFGIAGGYEGTNINTGFNIGNQLGSGGIVSVYSAVRLADSLSVTGQVGHGWLNYTENHQSVNGAFTGDRWFTAINLNFGTTIDTRLPTGFHVGSSGDWLLSGQIGYFYFAEVQSAYTETNGNAVASSMPYLGEVRLKGQVGYRFKTDWGSVIPFGSARLEFDTNYSDPPVISAQGLRASASNFGVTFSAGLKAALGERSSFIIEGTTTQFRQYFESYGINGSFRLQF